MMVFTKKDDEFISMLGNVVPIKLIIYHIKNSEDVRIENEYGMDITAETVLRHVSGNEFPWELLAFFFTADDVVDLLYAGDIKSWQRRKDI